MKERMSSRRYSTEIHCYRLSAKNLMTCRALPDRAVQAYPRRAPSFVSIRRWALQAQLYWAGRLLKTLAKKMTRRKLKKIPCKTPVTMLEDSVQNK